MAFTMYENTTHEIYIVQTTHNHLDEGLGGPLCGLHNPQWAQCD